jgi:hypothetical protein
MEPILGICGQWSERYMDTGKTLNQLLPENEVSYYFGFTGFTIAARGTLNEAQFGYGKHPNGQDLSGNTEGDWQKSWCVVGRDTLVGDPFFVDTSSKILPVFTAMHGVGIWEPRQVSDSLAGFLSGLEYLREQSKQKAELIIPDETTIVDDSELREILHKLVLFCGESSKGFWKEFFEQHKNWSR